jgi:NAD(P)-dependent dehydrogenase (short-subunit alcohol dehydrogenase family)
MSSGEFGKAHTLTPLGRSSTPADVAQAVRYLLDAPAITGTTLLVDGGQHLSAQSRDVAFLV